MSAPRAQGLFLTHAAFLHGPAGGSLHTVLTLGPRLVSSHLWDIVHCCLLTNKDSVAKGTLAHRASAQKSGLSPLLTVIGLISQVVIPNLERAAIIILPRAWNPGARTAKEQPLREILH